MSMHCAASIRTVRRLVVRADHLPTADLPTFLCPGLLNVRPSPSSTTGRRNHATRQQQRPQPNHRQSLGLTVLQRRCIATVSSSESATTVLPASLTARALEKLPRQCPGCGAYSQFVDKEEAGYYNVTRRTIKQYLGTSGKRDKSEEDAIVQAALQNAGSVPNGLDFEPKSVKPVDPPFCDRCHGIINHSTGVSIHHPTAHAIQDTILESPHKINHIYHIIDAADFPMSLIPQLQKLLNATPQRSHNRRSKVDKFYRGKKIEMSFIITRSDLLAGKKELVDAMMPYLRDTLRDALGRSAKDVRLGNVRCVSAKRQWWTSQLKEDIFARGGGGWMVGKVNVGKSQLLSEVFPKGRRDIDGKKKGVADQIVVVTVKKEEDSTEPTQDPSEASPEVPEIQAYPHNDFVDVSTLLPPPQPEVDYPTMPLVSSLPGTTASPIRLSFGRGKGELIDLPGLSRGDLELHVKPDHRASLVMRQRVEPKQQTIRPGHSLLLGGFIRITPTHDNVDILAYNFTPLEDHRTSTLKAQAIQAQSEEARNVDNIALPEAAAKTKLAGIYYLKWDVTKERTGPITNPVAVGIKPEKLPYKVLSTDILIEGVGWIELVAQVRKRPGEIRTRIAEQEDPDGATLIETVRAEAEPGNVWFSPLGTSKHSTTPVSAKENPGSRSIFESTPEPWEPVSKFTSQTSKEVEGNPSEEGQEKEEIDPEWPAVEVYTPDGKFVAARRPMNAWLNVVGKPKKPGVRPRKSMKGRKKEEKIRRRGW